MLIDDNPVNVTNAVYDGVTGLTTITTASNHGYNVGAAVTISGMNFTCDSALGTTPYSVNAATYDQVEWYLNCYYIC